MIPVYDFTWRGESAYHDYGICVVEIGSTVVAERRDDTYVVPGRSGLVHYQDGAVEEVEQPLAIYLPYEQGGYVAPMQAVRKWLKGYGALTLSTEPQRFRMAYITDQIALDPVMEGFDDRRGGLIFRCTPYLYHVDAPTVTLTDSAIVNNPGDAPARPLITINAIGDIDLMIGTQTVLLTGITGEIILDCEAEEAYTVGENDALINAASHMSGDFPLLMPGDNTISWDPGEDSSVTSIVIDPRWRDEG